MVLTAFALGRPVVACDVGGLAEYVEDGLNGLVVPPDDDALAAALIRCLTEPDLIARLERGVDETVHGKLSWNRAASDLLDVYEQASERFAAPR